MRKPAQVKAALQPSEPPMEDRFLKLPQVMQLVALGRTMIYRKVREGTFPRPLKPGGDSSRWIESEIRAWMAERKAERDAA